MKTEPALIISTLGSIEDTLASIEDEASRLAGEVKRGERFMKVYTETLVVMAEGETITERKVVGEALLHEDKYWTDHLERIERYEQLMKQIEILDIRRSIGQSMLKAQQPAEYPQHGQAA